MQHTEFNLQFSGLPNWSVKCEISLKLDFVCKELTYFLRLLIYEMLVEFKFNIMKLFE